MPFKTHRLIPTREKDIEVLQYAVTAPAPGLHPPLETNTEDLRNFGLVQTSNNLKEAEKEVKLYSEVSKTGRREMSQKGD